MSFAVQAAILARGMDAYVRCAHPIGPCLSASLRRDAFRCSVLPYFTEVVTALDGFPRKPDPAAILYLLEKYHLSPAASFYVGDRSLDVEAANNAGIGSILFLDPSSPISATGHETYVVKDLLEIPALQQEDTGKGTET